MSGRFRETRIARVALAKKVLGLKTKLRELLGPNWEHCPTKGARPRPYIVDGMVRGGATLNALANLELRDLAIGAEKDLDLLVEALIACSDLPPALRRDDKKFEAYFIEEMACCWIRLTGVAPGPSDQQFAEFVDAAHKTLGTTAPRTLDLPFAVERWDFNCEAARNVEINKKAIQVRQRWQKRKPPADKNRNERKPAVNGWVSQIKKTTDRLGDDVYRYERGLAPPNIGLQPSPVKRRFFQSAPENDEETKKLIAQMYSGGEELRRAAAQILWNEYELAGQSRRNQYHLELRFNPADALALIWPGRSFSLPPSVVP